MERHVTVGPQKVIHPRSMLTSLERPLFALDTYTDAPLLMMAAVAGDTLDPSVEESYRAAVDRHWPDTPPIARIDRFDFYERTKTAFAVLMTGETAKYGNIILKKGVTPV